MNTWRCFGCNSEKSSLSAACPVCDPREEYRETPKVAPKLVQNNVNFYGDMPFTASLLEENERLHEELQVQQRPGKYESPDYGYSLGMKLFGFTAAGIVWTGLTVIWLAICFFGWVVFKASTGG